MISPRAALAAGAAAAAGGALLLTGRLPGSAVGALALVLVARAAALGLSLDRPRAAQALARQVALAPVWAAVLAVGALRAGSLRLEDMRGANAVAGAALVHGDVLLVAAAWVAVLAASLGLLATLGPRLVLSARPFDRLEALGLALQVLLLVTLFLGPQVRDVIHLVPWILGSAVVALALVAGRALAQWDWLPRAATVLAFTALALALGGDPL